MTGELQSIRRSIYRGTYEQAEIECVARLLRPDDIVLELGSGCGVLSTFIAKQLSNSCSLFTVEANPRLLRSIQCIAEENGVRFTMINAVVGDSKGSKEFYFDESFLSSSTFDRGRGISKERVNVVSMAGLLEQVRPTFIVCDIEGSEREVLAVPLPRQVRVVCSELHPHIIGDNAVSHLIRGILNQGFDLLLDLSSRRSVAFVRAGSSA